MDPPSPGRPVQVKQAVPSLMRSTEMLYRSHDTKPFHIEKSRAKPVGETHLGSLQVDVGGPLLLGAPPLPLVVPEVCVSALCWSSIQT